ncbi:kinesin-like protein KIF21A isoform X1 [Rhodamnia argentea]|uniref:Kinesin-like protein KIF21A isoform X1 n=1 Tax=Rhodamnia argentea TaxID=178133 RepID=A0ABM3GWR6_9MYRT|nr:kinesin-like protein KIF21A isoform X1 [Rhodamnia argentea]
MSDQVEIGSIMEEHGEKKGKSKRHVRKKQKDNKLRDEGDQLQETNSAPDRSEVDHTSVVDDHSQGISSTSKKANERKRKKRNQNLSEEGDLLLGKNDETDKEEVYRVSSGNKDTSEGMKSKLKKVKRKKKKNHDLSEGDHPSTKYDEPDPEVHHMLLRIEDASEGMKSKTQKARRKKRKDRDFLEELGRLLKKNDYPDPGEVHPASSSGNGDTSEVTKRKSKKARRKKRKLLQSPRDIDQVVDKNSEPDPDDVHQISSGDEDESKGMKKWVMEYYQKRPGIEVLQQRIDDFITTHEATLEQERKEREARVAEGGWTVVTHHKGRKKTTDSESGIVVGSVSQAALEDKLAKKKRKEVGSDFYRFQRREAQRSEIMMLQSKFEQDRKRIQQLRAARKFRPY